MYPQLSRDRLTHAALWLGVLVPILYFGLQVVAALYPGYNFLSQAASDLGAAPFRYAAVFNTGVFTLGIVALVASIGFLRGLLRLGAHPLFAGLIAITVAAIGLASLWAAIFPLPDPRHADAPPFLMLAMLFPLLLTLALWKQPGTALLKAYMIASTMLMLALLPAVSGAISVDLREYSGLIQRLLAAAVFIPVGVGAFHLAGRMRSPLLLGRVA